MKNYSIFAVLLMLSLSSQAEAATVSNEKISNTNSEKYDVGASNVKVTVSDKIAQPNVLSLTLNNETYAYDATLARESRTVNMKILKSKRNFFENKRKVLLTDFTVSGTVATSKYNDNSKAFSIPIAVKREHSYASKISQNEVTPGTVNSGISGFIVLSDQSPESVGSIDMTVSELTGYFKVDEKDYNLKNSGNIYNAPMLESEDFHMILKEGVNVQKFGEYTIITDVSPISKQAVVGL